MLYRKIELKNTENNNNRGVLEQLLNNKSLNSKEEIEKFLNPKMSDFISPYAFCDMEKAVSRIKLAIEKQEKILIWGDFDCDGVTSTTILSKTLKELKANVIEFIPDRLLHGHGLNSKELIKLIAKEKVKLVITLDCGISNINEVNLLNGLKVDTIITDHHSTDVDIPNAYAIINPQVTGALKSDLSVEDITSLTYNCGAIVAYKLSLALLEDIDNKKLKEELLVIASCGAIADIVPLLGENRAIVAQGLKILNEKKGDSNKGIFTLLSKNLNGKEITSTDIAFILAPRINAVGRLANAKLSFDFLSCDNASEIEIIIQKLDNYNSIRQAKCSEVHQDILNYLEENKEEQKKDAVILINKNWHIGVIGIVAAHIVEEYQKPCFLMTIDENNCARCSIRSNESINVYQVLKENEEILSMFGGHKLAGGCCFDLNKISFEEVKTHLLKTIEETKTNLDKTNILQADIEIKPFELNFELLNTINKFEPFGHKNAAPVCVIFDVNLKEFKFIGKEQNHLKMIFEKEGVNFDCVKWKEENFLIPQGARCDIAFFPRINKFNDKETIQLEIIDIFCHDLKLNHSSDSETVKIYDHRLKKDILAQVDDYLKKEGLDIGIWAKTIATKEKLSKYPNIQKNITDNSAKKGLMFFDYPVSDDEFIEIISSIKPTKIHFMNCIIDENLENYIKQINGMIKFANNKMQGKIELRRFCEALGVSLNFIQIVLEILENINSIKILDIDKVQYLKPFTYEEFKNSPMFEVLKDEFNLIISYKKKFLSENIEDIEKMLV